MTKEDKESHVERIKARTGELDAEASVVELPFDEFDRSNCGRYCGHPTGAENGTGLLVFGYRAGSPARQTAAKGGPWYIAFGYRAGSPARQTVANGAAGRMPNPVSKPDEKTPAFLLQRS